MLVRDNRTNSANGALGLARPTGQRGLRKMASRKRKSVMRVTEIIIKVPYT
jgi:hypothetical protein